MKSSDLPAVQVTLRMRDGARRGDETLNRRLATEFAEEDVSGVVRELASTEGLATQGRDRLGALKEMPLRPQKTLAFPTNLMGL